MLRFLGSIFPDAVISCPCRKAITSYISIDNWNTLGDEVKFEGNKSWGFFFFFYAALGSRRGAVAWMKTLHKLSGFLEVQKHPCCAWEGSHSWSQTEGNVLPCLSLFISLSATRPWLISSVDMHTFLGPHLHQALCQDCSHHFMKKSG